MSRYFVIFLFLLCNNISSGQDHSKDDFLTYADSLEMRIKQKSLFLGEYFDTLSLLIEQFPSKINEGVFCRLKGEHEKSLGNLDEALHLYVKSVDILKSCCELNRQTVKSLMGLHGVYLNLGLFNFDTTYFKLGIENVKNALKISKALNDTSFIASNLDAIGDYNYYSAFQIQDMDTAFHYYNLTLNLIDGSKLYESQLADTYLGLSNVYRKIGAAKEGEFYFNKALSLANKIGGYSIIYALYNDKAEIFELAGDFDKALDLKLKSYEYVLKTNDNELISRADRQLYYTYKNLGDYKSALSYYEKYYDAVEKMHKSEALKLLNALEVQNEIAKKEIQISKLESQQYKSQNRFLILIGVSALLILLILSWAIIRLRRNNKHLAQKNKEILLARLKGQNIERKRMAGELHDNLNTKIAAVMWQLEALKSKLDAENSQLLDHSIGQLKDTYEDVRLISHNLMPETVESMGLIQTISDLLNKLNESDKVNFRLVTELPYDEHFGDLTYSLYNIIFEMINNILKHSEAKNAWVSISRNLSGDFDITVGDDGKGFEVDEMTSGYGIRNITARVDNLNGQWNIESKTGLGTKIYITIPNI